MNILITGSGSGIGGFLADSLKNQGHVVFGLTHTSCDVTKFYHLDICADQIARQTSILDAIIACAGTQGHIGKFMDSDLTAWLKAIEVNLLGSANTFRAFYRLVEKSRRGKVIFLSGGGAVGSRPRFSSYAVSKAGVVKLAEALADEYPGMDINAVAPGAIRTKMTETVINAGPDVAGEKEYNEALAFTTDGLPKVLDLVTFLISSESDGISGRLIAAGQFSKEGPGHLRALGPNALRLRRTDAKPLRT